MSNREAEPIRLTFPEERKGEVLEIIADNRLFPFNEHAPSQNGHKAQVAAFRITGHLGEIWEVFEGHEWVRVARESQADSFEKARRDNLVRGEVHKLRESLKPQRKNVKRTPIHFDEESRGLGAFVVLKVEVGADPINSGDGSALWVSARTRQALRRFEIPFNEGLPSKRNGNSPSV